MSGRTSILLDTNVLLRLIDLAAPKNVVTKRAVERLLIDRETIAIVAQNLYEFWVVATGPTDVNGLGLSTEATLRIIEGFRSDFRLLDDTPAIYPIWEHLVATAGVAGKKAHDARLVAAMMAHGVERVLTFNVADFRPYAGVRAQTPDEVLSG